MKLNQYIDHTLLKPTATISDIVNLCTEAKAHEFFAVCINSCHLSVAKSELEGSGVKLAAVIGFPLGAMSTDSKLCEAQFCIEQGADEIDMVINLGWFRAGLYNRVINEINSIKKLIGSRVLKVIVENCYLTDEEKVKVCELIMQTKAEFIKTSSGFGTGGATFEDMQLMHEVIQHEKKIKVSGGIKDKIATMKYIKMGASRIGTSSGIAIIAE